MFSVCNNTIELRAQRTKKQGNKGTAKSDEIREVAYICRYTSGIPITTTELCPLVHLQV